MRKLKRFVSLTRPEQFLLIRTWFLVLAMRAGLLFAPFRSMRRFAFKPRKKHESGFSVEKLVWAVKAVSFYVPGATCLTQAIAAQVLLSRAGHLSRVEIGVAKDEQNRLDAHAWLVLGDKVLIGGAEVDRYTPLIAWEEGN